MNIKRYLVEAAIDTAVDWKTKNDNVFKEQFVKYINDNVGKTAAEILNKFSPEFVRYYAKCAGKNPLSDKGNLFLHFINHDAAKNVLTSEDNFIKAYNITLDKSTGLDKRYIDTGDPNKCILYFTYFYTNIEDENVQLEVVTYDVDFFYGKTGDPEAQARLRNNIRDRVGFNEYLRSLRSRNKTSYERADRISNNKNMTKNIRNMKADDLQKMLSDAGAEPNIANVAAQQIVNANSTKD